MKRLFLLPVMAGLLLTSACTKSTSTLPANGWTFKSKTFSVLSTSTGSFYMLAASQSNPGYAGIGNLTCTFYAVPTASGTYRVASSSHVLMSDQIAFMLRVDSTSTPVYYSTEAHSTETVAVTVSGGKININGSGITLSNGVDSSALSVNIHQLD